MASPEQSLDSKRTVIDVPPLPQPRLPTPPVEAPTIPGYRITEEIARGGMGRIYGGYDFNLDREVAIKTLLPGGEVERFVTEAKITARLPHPNIPPVHALGTLEDGTPWLAMKRIRGRTLAVLLKERGSPREDLPRYIHIFESIAQAVGFAHARGVIHRDLKPLNVMVGEFGEVQVMDWGLAKDLTCEAQDNPSAGREPVVGNTARGADTADTPRLDMHTAPGTIMGTPAYMAPEQARGEVVDARADVFALGSILATILTDQPAFVGTSQLETVDKAARAKLADVLARLDACGADAELITLARRCLAARAEDRPRDAQMVADEVAAYRAGVEARLRQAETDRTRAETQATEQLKRRRLVQWAGSLIATVLLLGLAASLWQMSRAMIAEQQTREERDAKDRALQSESVARQKAMTALRTLTDEIVENQLARDATLLTEENRAFLRKIIEQYEGFAALTGDDAESRAIRAEGYARVGLMRHRLGEFSAAKQAYDVALELRKQLIDDFPSRPEFRQELALSHNSLGVLLSGTGRLKEAEAAYIAARDIQKQLAADFPGRPQFRSELAGSHLNLGNLLISTGRLKEAEAAFVTARDIHKQLAAEFPSRPEFCSELAASHNNLGVLLRATGRLKEAEAAYVAARDIHKQLVADFPRRLQFHQKLAGSHNNLGIILSVTGRLKEAEVAFVAAQDIHKQLATDFPSRPEFRSELATSHNNLGLLLSDLGRLKEAEAAYVAALNLRKQLVFDFPSQPDWRNKLAGTIDNLANLHQRQGELAKAKQRLLESRPHHLAALKANPRNPTYRQYYRTHLGTLAQVHAGLLEADEAVRVAHTRRELGWNPPADAYDAASFLSQCLPILDQHAKLEADKKEQALQFYATQAMNLLRSAVDRGFKDAAHLKEDGDFAPLRPREDFQKLLAELQAKEKT